MADGNFKGAVGMLVFFSCVLFLVGGYFIYGTFIEKIFGINPEAKTPALSKTDGVDYVPMEWWRIFLIQFLNIAGLGPIFGAVAGAMWGPAAFLWIIFGCLFIGAVHDYLSGMLSIQHGGESLSELVGRYLGSFVKQFMRCFSIVLLLLVGAVFITGPAKILEGLSLGPTCNQWAIIIFIYYILATMLPIDQLIGRIYPIFGFALLFMAVGISGSIFYNGYPAIEFSVSNLHNNPESFPIFPLLFISIACGAVSGFHATQSPMMARCLKSETLGKRVFFGAMIAEGIVALIWIYASLSFFGGAEKLNSVMVEHGGNAAWVVSHISNTLLGRLGGMLALLGVVAAPITSGDTAFRSARLTIADMLNFSQEKIINRLYVSVPLFIIGYWLTLVKFDIIWRYMAWANQTLAVMVLWAGAAYLIKKRKFHWIATIPAVFMTQVCSSYILYAKEGIALPYKMSVIGGAIFTVLLTVWFFVKNGSKKHAVNSETGAEALPE